MRRTGYLLLLLTALPVFAQEEEYDARELYDETCTQCHMQEGYVWERSFKAWQATVYTMQSYAYGEDAFSDEEADIIVDFLTENGERIEMELLGMLPEEQATVMTEAEPEVETGAVTVAETESIAVPPAEEISGIQPPGPYRAMFDFSAKISGYFGAAFLLGAMGTGLVRKKLKSNFRVVHRTVALALMTTAMFHSIYFLVTIGLPSLLWFWMGIGATAVLLATELGGRMRRYLKKIFLKVHIAGALIGLLATILHWVWIYI